jgi:hypothetical protein
VCSVQSGKGTKGSFGIRVLDLVHDVKLVQGPCRLAPLVSLAPAPFILASRNLLLQVRSPGSMVRCCCVEMT